MTNFTTTNSTAAPPSPMAHPHNSDISPLSAALCLVALIAIPSISYTLFVAMKCPRNPCRRGPEDPAAEVRRKAEKSDSAFIMEYKIEAEDGGRQAARGDDQCPVCLSAFAEGEEIRQLSACKHAFHAACIDMWLCSHSNCPVCRAGVPVKRSKRILMDRDDDFQQGLPDAADLV